MRYENGDGTFASKSEQAKFQFLKTAGLVMEGVYDPNGAEVTVKFAGPSGSREIPVTVRHREVNGVIHTAYVPSNRGMAEVRRAIAMR